MASENPIGNNFGTAKNDAVERGIRFAVNLTRNVNPIDFPEGIATSFGRVMDAIRGANNPLSLQKAEEELGLLEASINPKK